MKKTLFEGVATALVTPMNSDGSIDYKSLDKLVDWQIEQGINALVACGTTVDKDVPSGTFGIGRSYLTLKEGRAIHYLKKPPE